MRALILNADRFEDSELGEPLRLLQAKGVKVDVAAPHKGVITGKHGLAISAGLALAEVEPGDYDLLVLFDHAFRFIFVGPALGEWSASGVHPDIVFHGPLMDVA
jgi:hypothetical protein